MKGLVVFSNNTFLFYCTMQVPPIAASGAISAQRLLVITPSPSMVSPFCK